MDVSSFSSAEVYVFGSAPVAVQEEDSVDLLTVVVVVAIVVADFVDFVVAGVTFAVVAAAFAQVIVAVAVVAVAAAVVVVVAAFVEVIAVVAVVAGEFADQVVGIIAVAVFVQNLVVGKAFVILAAVAIDSFHSVSIDFALSVKIHKPVGVLPATCSDSFGAFVDRLWLHRLRTVVYIALVPFDFVLRLPHAVVGVLLVA